MRTASYSPISAACRRLLLLTASLGAPLAGLAQYTPGNLVVVRVGTGNGALSAASAPTFLDEYTPAGVLQQSLELPNSGSANKLTNAGSSTLEGSLTLSADGRYLLLAGYNAEVGVASVSTTTATAVARTVARVDANRVVDVSTALSDAYSSGNIRGAASTTGSGFFLSGSNAGVRYAALGSTTSSNISTSIANTRVVRLYRNRVYFSTGAGAAPGIYVLDAGAGTAAGQAATLFLPTGSGTGSASPCGFLLLDRDANVPGFDAAYVTDDGGGSAPAGIQKWSFDGSTWTRQGIIGTAYRSLTGTISADGSAVTLYATTTTTAGGNQLVVATDANAYNAPPSTTSVTTRATAVSNAAFRSVEFAPGTAVVLPVTLTSFGATRALGGVQLRWATASELNSARFEVQRSLDGHAFATITSQAAAGSSVVAHRYLATDAAAPTATTYYRLRQVDQDGTATYSPTVTVAAGGPAGFTLAPNPAHASISFMAEGATAYCVRTVLGQVLRAGSNLAGPTTVAIDALPAGLYFLELRTETGLVVRRFVKE